MIEASFNVHFDEPLGAFPRMMDVGEGGMTAALWAKSMRVGGELRLIVGFEDHTKHFLE